MNRRNFLGFIAAVLPAAAIARTIKPVVIEEGPRAKAPKIAAGTSSFALDGVGFINESHMQWRQTQRIGYYGRGQS